MLRKKETYTVTTPIPTHVPRELALDILHSHGEIITLNPLVLSHNAIKAPRDASADEYYSTWYEITERVQYIPGVGKFGSGKISFKGCFHDEPWGIRTHTLAPMGIDLRTAYRVVGNQPGEPPDPNNHGNISVPQQGLYLHQDVVIECNVTLISFVRGQMKASTKVLVDRFIKKAELLGAGVLQGTVEDGRLRTFNPADRTSTVDMVEPGPTSPALRRLSYQIPRSPSQVSRSGSISSQQFGQDHASGRSFAAELPADTYHAYRPPPGSDKHDAMEMSATSYGLHNRFPVELPAMQEETPEERSGPRKYTYHNV
ncbi:hypothetical protein BDW59DRAFT_132508 [Aspergillus cavernicola]|uniref:DUF7053 domain-containing protein n=1 Tax=Aspergillus cavernicola TaxID=176166 RepID=A0ABR4HPW8_9EURO